MGQFVFLKNLLGSIRSLTEIVGYMSQAVSEILWCKHTHRQIDRQTYRLLLLFKVDCSWVCLFCLALVPDYIDYWVATQQKICRELCGAKISKHKNHKMKKGKSFLKINNEIDRQSYYYKINKES